MFKNNRKFDVLIYSLSSLLAAFLSGVVLSLFIADTFFIFYFILWILLFIIIYNGLVLLVALPFGRFSFFYEKKKTDLAKLSGFFLKRISK